MVDEESFEDFSARVLPMWSCCPFHKNGGDTEMHCTWRLGAIQRDLDELAQHADHLNRRIVALDDVIVMHLKWLEARADWLRLEYQRGGNLDPLSREAECRLAIERLKELQSSASGDPK